MAGKVHFIYCTESTVAVECFCSIFTYLHYERSQHRAAISNAMKAPHTPLSNPSSPNEVSRPSCVTRSLSEITSTPSSALSDVPTKPWEDQFLEKFITASLSRSETPIASPSEIIEASPFRKPVRPKLNCRADASSSRSLPMLSTTPRNRASRADSVNCVPQASENARSCSFVSSLASSTTPLTESPIPLPMSPTAPVPQTRWLKGPQTPSTTSSPISPTSLSKVSSWP